MIVNSRYFQFALLMKGTMSTLRIAYFISPHGFGHAARASAVIEALQEVCPSVAFELYTQVPEWFFTNSLQANLSYHPVWCDVGLKQHSSLKEDFPATIEALSKLYPLDEALVSALATELRQLNCQLVLCDIAPLGIAVAKKAGLPSVLMENFTWNWIYRTLVPMEPRLEFYADYLQARFEECDHLIQLTPVCLPKPADLTPHPVARNWKQTPAEVFSQLGLPADKPKVLITMGGIGESYQFLERLKRRDDVSFVIPAAAAEFTQDQNLTLLSANTGMHHPDLLRACDLVIGKLGYSTVSEVYYAGVPFGFIGRYHFAESAYLQQFVQSTTQSFEIQPETFQNGEWLERIDPFLKLPRLNRDHPNGSRQIADYLIKLVNAK